MSPNAVFSDALLGTGHTLNLSEIDEEAQAAAESQARGPVGIYDRVLLDARRTNLLRRLWIRQDATVLVPFLETLMAELDRVVRESVDISEQLEQYTMPTGPRHLSATVVVTNTGRRPLALGSQGVLFLHLPARAKDTPDRIVPANVETTGQEPNLVPGGEAKVIKYVTHDNLETLFEAFYFTDVEGFRSLYDEGGIRARVSIARVGTDVEHVLVGPSEIRPIGPKSIDNVFQVIRSGDRLYQESSE